MNRLTLTILASSIITFMTLFICDIQQWIYTPLSPLGTNHWIPEAFTLFLIGRYITKNINKNLIPIIIGCIFFYPILIYTSMKQLSFGIGTSCFFISVLIMGIWSGISKKEN